MEPKDKVRVVALGPFRGMQGRVEEYIGKREGAGWMGPESAYRVALVNGMTLTFVASELEVIK